MGFLMSKIMKNQLCEIKLSYKPKPNRKELPVLNSSDKVFDFIRHYFDAELIEAREEFVVIYLNRSNKVKGVLKAFQGGTSSTVVDVKMILATALKSLSSSIVVAHNHPSGSLKPSQNDISLTRKIKEACGLVDIQMLVHLILTPANEYYSFADEGCL